VDISSTQYNVWTFVAHITPNMFIYHTTCGWRICSQHLNVKITLCQPSLYVRRSDVTQKSAECLEVTKKSGYQGESLSSKKRQLVRIQAAPPGLTFLLSHRVNAWTAGILN